MKGLNLTRKTPRGYVEKLATCEQCGHCCKHGTGYVLKEDIPRIAAYLGITEQAFMDSSLEEVEQFNTRIHKIRTDKKGKPFGPCIFFREGNACMIHDVKPFHCRIGSCNEYGEEISLWFMLNFLVNPSDPESIRQYAAYLKTHPTIPGGELHELVPDKVTLGRMLDYSRLK